ncbi:MAG: hypothetical protein A4E57_02241 [Syntrophorhabdaceae bacterium PtaU1.Bin034]|nr:MAG: hypothetical protein A4E57_02241 [Syntrophorhabdaceae bacterium PtaU1.Bin034]
MRSLIIIILATLLFVSITFAGEFGPPEPVPDPGRASVGVGYFFDRTGLKQDGVALKTKSNQYYIQADYSFVKDWEVYGRLGGADMVVHSRTTGQRFSDAASVYGSLGLKGIAYQSGNFAVGPFVEGSLYGDHTNVATNQWDANVGVSAQYKVQGVTLYGGPFAYWHRADSQLAINPAVSQDEIKERHNIGAFLGARVPVVSRKVFLTAEAQLKNKPGGGASISYKF